MKILAHTGGVFQTNGYILAEDNGTCIVIDAPAEIADFLNQNSLRATHLLLTHQHLDHIEDAAKLRAQGARILGISGLRSGNHHGEAASGNGPARRSFTL
jgi:glyoxylase-like metal-dependent hydrolase (beta-lactamase superfamily II)